MDFEHIPAAFLALERAGRFDYYGASHGSVSRQERQHAELASRLDVLFWDEVIAWDRTVEAVVSFTGDSQMRPGLVPFAGNGHGDHYCWYPRWQEGPEPPVIFYAHDDYHSHLFARDFAEFLVRCMLQHFVGYLLEPLPGDPVHEEPSAREQWDAHLQIVRPHLSGEQVALLEGIGADLSPEACEDADDQFAEQIETRKLVGRLLPVKYEDELIIKRDGQEALLAAYDRSVAFYHELVHDEGRDKFADQLAAAQAARESARSRG